VSVYINIYICTASFFSFVYTWRSLRILHVYAAVTIKKKKKDEQRQYIYMYIHLHIYTYIYIYIYIYIYRVLGFRV
jgi:hypothetical protein